MFHRYSFSSALQWAAEFEKRGFLTHTTLGSLSVNPNLNEKSVNVVLDEYGKVYIQLDKVSHYCSLSSIH